MSFVELVCSQGLAVSGWRGVSWQLQWYCSSHSLSIAGLCYFDGFPLCAILLIVGRWYGIEWGGSMEDRPRLTTLSRLRLSVQAQSQGLGTSHRIACRG